MSWLLPDSEGQEAGRQVSQVKAVVFDFDGLVLDTETPEFLAWEEEFACRGQILRLEEWQKSVGTDPSVWNAPSYLASLIGPIDVDELKASFQIKLDLKKKGASAMPGVLSWVEDLKREGIPYAIASSSRLPWIADHLAEAGLTDLFPIIISRDERFRAKPFPDLYTEACRVLQVEPGSAAALEDSSNGVKAAKAAGMWAIAVPCSVTRSLDFTGADLVTDSLAEFRLADLKNLMAA